MCIFLLNSDVFSLITPRFVTQGKYIQCGTRSVAHKATRLKGQRQSSAVSSETSVYIRNFKRECSSSVQRFRISNIVGQLLSARRRRHVPGTGPSCLKIKKQKGGIILNSTLLKYYGSPGYLHWESCAEMLAWVGAKKSGLSVWFGFLWLQIPSFRGWTYFLLCQTPLKGHTIPSYCFRRHMRSMTECESSCNVSEVEHVNNQRLVPNMSCAPGLGFFIGRLHLVQICKRRVIEPNG